MSKNRKMTYSLALTELQQIIDEIESEEINVDVLAEKVRKAAYLIKFCKDRLRNTEEEVGKVLSEIDGPEETNNGEINPIVA